MSNFKKESISVVLAQFTGYHSMVHEKSFMNIIDGIFVGFFSHKKCITLSENWITVLTLSSSIKHFWRHWDHSQVKSAPNCCLMYGLNFYPPNIHVSSCWEFSQNPSSYFSLSVVSFWVFFQRLFWPIYLFCVQIQYACQYNPIFETISLFSWSFF